MPAPEGSHNARKGKTNRKMWSQRLPVDVRAIIAKWATELGISQADYISAIVRKDDAERTTNYLGDNNETKKFT